jgi:ecotropic viral integration site 5 protein
LLRSSQDRLQHKRVFLWLKLLKVDLSTIQADFKSHSFLSKEELTKNVEDHILVDIQRSFKQLPSVSQENLKNILHANAVADLSMEYCQGMNFMAGFLYLCINEEATAFSLLKHVIRHGEMATLMDTTQPMLKACFYKLDRLISLHIPDLHQHFKVRTH